MTAVADPPLVILPACRREIDGRMFHAVPEAYAEALRFAGCQPLLVPGVGLGELPALLELAAGILLPGTPSNVHPSHFGEEVL
ncbi:MAG: gamma-glutamyl-gamma-aminobutyrate hydrolase family protein, partial [Akkermansiaceae bacterium]|nr:gamma-glutamyl-gamma-aminobutyrate hydrolase family protein [Akkermansiaceae bacterium]